VSNAISLIALLGALQHFGYGLRKILEWIVFLAELYATGMELLGWLWIWLNASWPLN
jgi:hypothetical protein